MFEGIDRRCSVQSVFREKGKDLIFSFCIYYNTLALCLLLLLLLLQVPFYSLSMHR